MKLEELFVRTDRYNFVVDLTPEIATDWIDHCNTHNRKLIDSHVEYLANELKAGRWRLTHQSTFRFSVQLRKRSRMKSGCQRMASPLARSASFLSRRRTNHWRVDMNSSGRSPFS